VHFKEFLCIKANLKETTIEHIKTLGLDRKGGFGSTGTK